MLYTHIPDISCFYTDTIGDNLALPTAHFEYEMILITSGRGTAVINHKTYELIPGSLVFINRLERHNFIITQEPYCRYVVSISSDLILSFVKDANVPGKLKKLLGMTATYSRHDDCLAGKTDTPYIAQMQQDIRTAKQKADVVLFYPHVGGQFNEKPGAFTEYIVDKAVEAGADAVIATHSHIPQKLVEKAGIPCAYCLGNFNMNPNSYLAMPEILTNYGYALHLYVEEKKIVKVTFSMLKNCTMPDGQIASYPVEILHKVLKTDKEKALLEKEIRHLYGRITGRVLEGEILRREYEM